ncbi:YheC/YheD family protein [Evansella cellulosilytica]|uniref:YheC/YheD family protein n=1 Tax=Evansella cellulosilytica (strain ATCC 21833 / DSM 2522 / FERM P-1141 / JCM 9156 / N-4) TaxID=649639 RepID=E6TUF4_EVAC2|nr:YheC/YheD family protein [Evansella cellulosilytica]ADU29710.1 hypothetical protein Bcell_1447 [Evansella cellulosilytica DSM 2522]
MTIKVLVKQREMNDNDDNDLYFPISLLKEWNLNEGDLQTIIYGTKEVRCKVNALKGDSHSICELSKEAWSYFSLPFSISLSINRISNNKMVLGPITGIYTAGFTGSILRPVGDRSFLLAKYIHAARCIGAFAYVFGAHHINWEEEMIEGYTFSDSGWKKVIVPFPDVIYDRLPNRRTEAHPLFSNAREKLQSKYEIPWFNPGFFDKSKIYDILIQLDEVNHLLPKTISAPTQDEIIAFIHEQEHVYMKPKNGSLGVGIHQITYDPNSSFYYCRFRDNTRNRLRRYSSLLHLLKTQFKQGYDQYVIQQGISLMKYQNNPIDFRVHTNKDEKGIWRMSAIAAKIAGPGSVTTHVKSGGHIKLIEEIWEDLDLNKSLLNNIKHTALRLSSAIDKKTDGYIGEIGFDIGVDEQERIWMFEANSKPGRTIFSHPKLSKEDLLTRKMPIQYAIYLYESMIESLYSKKITLIQ